MAKYWVGGTGNSSDPTNHWATTDGGAPGVGNAPTAADDVFFTTNSGAGTATIDAALSCRSLQSAGTSVATLVHNAAITTTIGDGTAGAGNIALDLSGFTTYTRGNATTSAMSFNSTSGTVQTIKTNAKILGNLTFATAGSWQLADTCTTSNGGTTTLTFGTLDLNAKTLDTGIWSSSNPNVRAVNNGTIILRSTGTAWAMGTSTNATTDGNLTVSLLSTAGAQTMIGSMALGTISRVGANNATDSLRLGGNMTATNLSLDTCSFISNTAGTTRTLTLTNAPTFTNVGTITDITIPASIKVDAPSSIINGGNNTGIAFLGSPSLIQTSGVSVTTPAASATASFANATRNLTTSKQGIVVQIQARTVTTPPVISSVTDSAGNSYVPIVGTGSSFGTAQGWHEWWWCPNSVGGVTSVTVNASINSNFGVTIIEMSDANTLDQIIQSTGNSITAATGPTGKTNDPKEMILGYTGAHLTPGTIGTSAGFQMFTVRQSSGAPILISRGGFQTSTATNTYSWSTALSGAAFWAATIVTLKYVPPSRLASTTRQVDTTRLATSDRVTSTTRQSPG